MKYLSNDGQSFRFVQNCEFWENCELWSMVKKLKWGLLVLRLRLAIYINRIGSLFKLLAVVHLLLFTRKSFRHAVFAKSSVITVTMHISETEQIDRRFGPQLHFPRRSMVFQKYMKIWWAWGVTSPCNGFGVDMSIWRHKVSSSIVVNKWRYWLLLTWMVLGHLVVKLRSAIAYKVYRPIHLWKEEEISFWAV